MGVTRSQRCQSSLRTTAPTSLAASLWALLPSGRFLDKETEGREGAGGGDGERRLFRLTQLSAPPKGLFSAVRYQVLLLLLLSESFLEIAWERLKT